MEYEITPKGKVNLGLSELWQYRELFYFFTWRDIKVKYKQTILGFAWAILQPLFFALIFTVFLGELISNKVNLKMPYPVFVLSGMILWNVFSTGLSSAANSMVSNSNIIKKIYFPRLIIPLSSVLVSLFDFLMAFLVLIPFLLFYNISLHWEAIFYIPLSLIITVISCVGLGSFLSALNLKYRDFRYVIPFLIQALLFITPVIYPSNLTDNTLIKWIVLVNPMTAAIEFFRASFTGEFIVNLKLVISSLSGLVFLIVGIYYFRKTEYYFADIA